MAQYIVTDTELTSVAAAIRLRGGTSALLTWPSGYAQAIRDIPGGGGGSTILSGADAPTAAVGADGYIYLQYEDTASIIAALPSDATLLSYIESSGTQWINTGVPGNTAGLRAELVVQPLATNDQGYFGNAWAANGFFLMIYQSKWRFHSGGGSVDDGLVDTTAYSTLLLENNKLTVNGVAFSLGGGANQSGNLSMLYNFGSGYGGMAKAKLQSAKLDDGNTLLRDYYPVQDGNGVACLYDMVGQQYVYNSGSGVFAPGAVRGLNPIIAAYAKVNGAWQALIGTPVGDVA